MATVEVRFGQQAIDVPKLLFLEGVSEALYDALTALEEDVKAELLDGVMVVHSPEKTRHEQDFRFLFVLMNLFAYAHHWGEVLGSMATVHLGECRKVKPDIAAVRLERAHIITEDAIEGVPDLVLEIVSESTRRYDFGEKRKVYEEAGVPEIWRKVMVVRRWEGVIAARRNQGEFCGRR
jgi:Uma2 family endonuclease